MVNISLISILYLLLFVPYRILVNIQIAQEEVGGAAEVEPEPDAVLFSVWSGVKTTASEHRPLTQLPCVILL